MVFWVCCEGVFTTEALSSQSPAAHYPVMKLSADG